MRTSFAATALLASLLGFASPGWAGNYLQSVPPAPAQQAPSAAPAPAPAKAPPPAARARPTQSAGAAAPQQGTANPQAAQAAAGPKPDLSEQSGEWVLQCWKQPVRNCQLLQRRIEAKTRQQILLAAIAIRADGSRRMTMITPLGFKSNPALSVSVDKAPFIELPLKSCLPAGCLQIGDISQPLLEKLENSNEMSIVLQGLNGQNFNLSIPVKGLKEGLATISQFIAS